AVALYQQLVAKDTGNQQWQKALMNAQEEEALAENYAEGLEFLQQGNLAQAQLAFERVAAVSRDYKDVGEHLARVRQRLIGKSNDRSRRVTRIVIAGGAIVILLLCGIVALFLFRPGWAQG